VLRQFTDDESIASWLGLESQMLAGNMHLFDSQGMIRKYDSPLEIMDEFYSVRLALYHDRVAAQAAAAAVEAKRARSKARFIEAVVGGQLELRKSGGKAQLTQLLAAEGYAPLRDGLVVDADGTARSGDYDYLTGLPLWNLTVRRGLAAPCVLLT